MRIIHISGCGAIAIALLWTQSSRAEFSPASGAMIGIKAVHAIIKKDKEKTEQEQALANKLAKLQERYPKDVEEFRSLETSDPAAAQKKLTTMLGRYQEDTGVDLNQLYDVKSEPGPIKRLKERLTGESSTAPATPATTEGVEVTKETTGTTETAASSPAAENTSPTEAAPATAAQPAAAPEKQHRGLLRGLFGGIRDEVKDGRHELIDTVEDKLEPAASAPAAAAPAK